MNDKINHLKDESYYKDAELMQEGWGETLRHIDVLKNKVSFNEKMTGEEFTFTLFGDCYNSHCIRHFKFYLASKLKIEINKKMLTYESWKRKFRKWHKTEYNTHENLV